VKSIQKQPFKLKKGCGQVWQDGQGEKVVKSRWQPRNGCDNRSMAKILITIIQVNFVLIPSEAGIRTQIDLNCFY